MNESNAAAEVWLDPLGRPAHLIFLGDPEPVAIEGEDYEGWDGWHADFPGQRPPKVWELRNVDNPRLRLTHTVFPLAPWSAYDAIFDILVRDGWTPPAQEVEDDPDCEHGLSARLCSGPSHYPMDL